MSKESSDSESGPSSHLSRLRFRSASFVDGVAAFRWRVGAVLAVLIVAVAGWGFTRAGQATPLASTPTFAPRSTSTTVVGEAPAAVSAGLVVYATGAIGKPGVYRLKVGARVENLIDVAGGLTDDADPDRVNLAAKVTDGQHVVIARKGQATPVADDSSGSTTQIVNINDASAKDLEALPGVGPSTAAAIVAYRTAHGAFRSVADLAKVKGIGPAKLDALKAQAQV